MLHTRVSSYMGALAVTVVGAVATFLIMDAAHLAAESAEEHGVDVFAYKDIEATLTAE